MISVITQKEIQDLNLWPETTEEWIVNSFLLKTSSDLPAKVVQVPFKGAFITTMPCIIPDQEVGGVKIVSRYPDRKPLVQSTINLFSLKTGQPIAFMDGSLITNLRTGAATAIAVKLLAKKNFKTIGFVGLGTVARFVMNSLLPIIKEKKIEINLFKYKNQAEIFANEFSDSKRIKFNIIQAEDKKNFIGSSDVIISCVTFADKYFADEQLCPKGILLVPVHTRGFQNCDKVFDRIFGDDTEHLKKFEYFNNFRYYDELVNVIKNESKGRQNDCQRIISYNIGIALHDIYFAYQIYRMLESSSRKIFI